MKQIMSLFLSLLLFVTTATNRAAASMPEIPAEAAAAVAEAAGGPQVQAQAAILMEASTGTVIFEKNADEARNPASVTKIMTLILIFDALKTGKIHLDDEVVTSAHAKSMGGSQVFLGDPDRGNSDQMHCHCIRKRRQRGYGGVHRRGRGNFCADDE